MKKIIVLLLVFYLSIFSLFGQESVLFSEVQQAKENKVHFETVVLPVVSPESEILKNFSNPDEVLFFGAISLDWKNSHVKAMNLQLAGMTLELIEAPEYFYDYVVTTSSGAHFSANRNIKHYRGIIQNDRNSLVAITFYEDEIMGLVCTAEGNFNIAKDTKSNKHILYNDKNLKEKMHLTCGTMDDDSSPYEPEVLLKQRDSSAQDKKVGFYVETEYDIYQARGSVASIEAFISGMFNQVAILYQNEDIATAISELFIWTSEDPYTGTDTDYLLRQFKRERTEIIGNLGILLTYRGIGGGQAAGFSGLCNPSTSESLAVAGINNAYNTVPKYSWNIMVATHELGHLFGSRHTHACVWNGDDTAIDGCAGYVEGHCALLGNPPEGGTMMSYCHNTNVGINFTLGFGPQPGNVIRNNVDNADCLKSLTLEIMNIRIPEETKSIEPGETSDIQVYLKNISDNIATNLTAELTTNSPYLTINQSTAYYGQLHPEQYKYRVYNITLNPDTPTEITELPVILIVTDNLGRKMELDAMLHLENSGEPPQSCNSIENLSTEIIDSDIILSWDAPSGEAPEKYLIYCNGLFLKETTDITYTHEAVELGIYNYCVEAVYENGCTSEWTCIETVTPCDVDLKLTLRVLSSGVVLSWLPKMANVTYKVYCNGEFIAETTTNTHKEAISNFEEKYCYTVKAVCPADLESEPSNEKCAGGVGIDELENKIKIYPNPTSGIIQVKSNGLQVMGVEVFDIAGKNMNLSIPPFAHSSTFTIDISDLPSGTYFLRVQTENETFIRKVVKQ